jgi:putative hydrolase of the HAD superfamily
LLNAEDFLMRIKAIFFDAAGTLIKPVRPVGESYALLARKYGKDVSPAETRERFRFCFSSAPPLAFPGARDDDLQGLETGWWKELVWKVFEPYGSFARFDDYFAELFEYFGRPDSWMLYPETDETLAALSRSGLTLAVISNFDSRLLKILTGLRIAAYFRSIFLSSRVGHAKPARQIFHHALSQHGVEAGEALHVGDSPDKDAAGAASAGLTGVLLDRNGKAVSNSFPKVRNLSELPALIDQRS